MINLAPKYVIHLYYKLRNWQPVWNFLNREGRTLYQNSKPNLNKEQQRIADEIRKNGIAVTTLEALFPGKNMLQVMNTYAGNLNPEDAEQGKKKYLKKYWDRFPKFDLSNPFVSFILHPTVLDIVNTYMGMYTKLKYYDLAKTLVVPAGSEAVQSQRWHRDPEEKKICKVFIYLNDVDEGSGPFIYVKESNEDGKLGNLFPQETPEGSYMTDEEIEKSIPKENVKIMTGKAGTVIFCDTSGIHKGGYATTGERLMFTAFFTSSTYSDKPSYKLPESFNPRSESLSPQAIFALQK